MTFFIYLYNKNYHLMRDLKYILAAAILACVPFTVSAQFMFGGGNRAAQDSLRKIAAADYADMLAKVGAQ